MAAHHRTEGTPATAEQVDALRAVAGRSRPLLAIDFLAGAIDFGAVLDLVRAGSPLGQLPDDVALNEIRTRLEAEDRIGQLDRAGGLAVERGDLHFHVTRPPARPAWPRRPSASRPKPSRSRPDGTCQAGARPSAAPSSPRRAR